MQEQDGCPAWVIGRVIARKSHREGESKNSARITDDATVLEVAYPDFLDAPAAEGKQE